MALVTAFGLVLALALPSAARADSPLTSTSLAAGYESEPLVVEAAQSGMTPAVAAALSDPAVPHDLRAAIVATFGWSLGGQDNARRYLDFVARDRGTTPARLQIVDLTAEEALAVGYLRAMDDYLGLTPIGGNGQVQRSSPLTLLEHARRSARGDPVVALVHGLVRAQHDLHKGRWCDAYHDVFDVLSAEAVPLRRPALDSVTGYMALYRSSC